MFETSLLLDLTTELPRSVRQERLVSAIRTNFGCSAVGLLKLDGDCLCPVAVDGLVHETLGRRFVVAQHPRLATILSSRSAVRFEPESLLPDPYDGLLDSQRGLPLPVHDCMGISLYLGGQLWGALTLDAFEGFVFDDEAVDKLTHSASLTEVVIRMSRLEEEILALRVGNRESEALLLGEQNTSDGEIIGQSAIMLKLLNELDVVADSELPVLLLGETGVGKELFARRLHSKSPRHIAPLIHVNCAALPESLAESELFGHVKGAFSGAISDRPGRFEAAHGGTLFLDEVGELPLTVQAKLLRTLQNGEIQRLGTDQQQKVDVRIIAATNRQLHEQVREGQFRADLYHRLSVYPVPIPPLRKRDNDVLLLAGNFLELNRARLGFRSLRLSREAEQALFTYDWPGNVRELEHVISRAALRALSRGAVRTEIVTLEPEHLALDANAICSTKTEHILLSQVSHDEQTVSLKIAVDDYQRKVISQTLDACQGNWANVARRLVLDPSNLHKLAKRLGLK
ncbi:nitric oxide reductase transcriptional regulator NorR [Aeromonas australiensis]|uniref:nitric oxide reductase transcriptional regulator NorR n=1 Tax=Aeromonas australiensis TaxID=1114880 RepID=UPI001F2FFF83|nr:nitric oxide reductase transcriptional regulator NorR [Aeromonas australiensis]MCF3099640.1 nitric oxide reductase transcriptional regulator NorR [Aeromonas australiensis]